MQVWHGLDDVDTAGRRRVAAGVGRDDRQLRRRPPRPPQLIAGVVARARELGRRRGRHDLRPAPDDGDPPRLRAAAADRPSTTGSTCWPARASTPSWCCPSPASCPGGSPTSSSGEVLVERAARRRGARRARTSGSATARPATSTTPARRRGAARLRGRRRCRWPATRTRWSSTYVRQCLAEGDVAAAATALGRPHRVEGPVVVGDQARPRARLPDGQPRRCDDDAAVPADGVYAGWLIRADGTPAAGRDLDRHQPDLRRHRPPGRGVRARPGRPRAVRRARGVDFLERLRETVTFDGVEPLLAQMALDVDRARALTTAS